MHKKFYFLFSTIFFLVATSCFSITNENATYTTVDPPASIVSATMELAADGVEDPLFDNIDETRKNKTADYPYNPDYPTNAKVSKLATGLGETVGPATILAVKQGDEMSVSTDYYFTTPLLPQTNQTAEQILSGIVGSFTTAGLSTLPLDDLGNVINPFIDANSQAASGLNSFIQNSFDSLNLSLPQGYLVTMFFDNDLNIVPEYSGVQRVTEAGSLQKLAVMNQKMPSDGFYYTYVTNQSAQVTQFDNLTYIHIEGVLKEATDYYPYGLLCSSATIGSVNTSNNYKFQDKEFNRKEFVNTWGLDWYNHGARMYDPELGRWHVQDPASQFANPYLAMGNNPVMYIDPDGRFIGTFLTGIVQAVKTTLQTGWNFGEAIFDSSDEGWDNFSNEWKHDMRNFDPTLEGTINNNAIRIDMGMFKTDENRTPLGRAFQLGSRFTWEAPQTILGNLFSHGRNNAGKVDNVDYYGGATLVNDENPNTKNAWGLTLSNYINSENVTASPNDPLFRHEYGHTLQSRLVGPLYLPKVGLPSLIGSGLQELGLHSHDDEWNEIQANRMAYNYFNKFEPDVFDRSKGGKPWNNNNYPREYVYDWYFYLTRPPLPFMWWLKF
jgi:RHS repeat-associated protein